MSSLFSARRFVLAFVVLSALLLLYLSLYHLPAPRDAFSIIKSSTSTHDLLDDTSNSTLGFQKIFVINLPSRTDLRDAVTLAATLSGLDIEIVDGIDGATIPNKSLPNGGEKTHLSPGGLGNWRAHMNVARKIVEQNLQSALVIENDADWDIRIKQQMRQFAQASRLLLQPLKDTNNTFLDPTNPRPSTSDDQKDFDITDEGLKAQYIPPTTSPYGDLERWDLLWLGHCGCRFPWASDVNAPLGRAVISNDVTVPEKHHIDVELGDQQLMSSYPDHTRVVSRARVNSCTLGHAFSQQGARSFLYELSIKEMDGTTDMMFRSMCDGVSGRPLAICLTVQPQLFQHHRPKGSKAKESDIDSHGNEYNPHGYTANVRWSTRLNFHRLTSGRTDYIDLYQDGVYETSWSEDE